MKKLSREDFILRAKAIHGNKFSYGNVMYFGGSVKIIITCPDHGDFKQLPKNHLSLKQGCPKCYGNKKLTTEEFIQNSKLVHEDRYDYGLTKYAGNKSKVEIYCKEHGIFKQIATRHLSGDGCPKCGGSERLTTNEFIKRSKEIHGDKYGYDHVNYVNGKTKIEIECFEHGIFRMIPNAHIGVHRQGCRACAIKKQTLTEEEFIQKAKSVHGELYDYSLANYRHNNIAISIVCNKHGVFQQKPNTHLNGRGCRVCKNSKGELKILNWLKNNEIVYQYQKEFEDCVNVRPLKFDFYLPDYNMIIEFDGDQHKKSIRFFGGDVGLEYRRNNDKIKNQYAKVKDITLLRISYNDLRNNKVEKILSNNIKQLIHNQ